MRWYDEIRRVPGLDDDHPQAMTTTAVLSSTWKLEAANGDYWGLEISHRSGAEQLIPRVVWSVAGQKGSRDVSRLGALHPRMAGELRPNEWHWLRLHTSPEGRFAVELHRDDYPSSGRRTARFAGALFGPTILNTAPPTSTSTASRPPLATLSPATSIPPANTLSPMPQPTDTQPRQPAPVAPTATFGTTGVPNGGLHICDFPAFTDVSLRMPDPVFFRPPDIHSGWVSSDPSMVLLPDGSALNFDTQYVLIVEDLPFIQVKGVALRAGRANTTGCWYSVDLAQYIEPDAKQDFCVAD